MKFPAGALFDHVKFGVSDYAASKAFFLRALEPLGVAIVGEGAPTYGVELCQPHGKVSLCLFQTEEKPAHLHLAFAAENRQQVDAFHRAALAAGAEDNGPPGLRPQYHATYYAAFVIGPDGHNIEVVCHAPEACGTSEARLILEAASLQVRPGQAAAFESAFREAQAIIASMPGYRSHELQRCLEREGQYLLLVRWDSVAAHEEGFRRSPRYQEWKRLLHHFYDPFPTVLHHEQVDLEAP